jgi:hypothetical protein
VNARNFSSDITDYERRHLLAHLEAGDLIEQIHQLLSFETADHENVWYKIQKLADDVDQYIADINQALAIAQTKAFCQLKQRDNVGAVGLMIRYALLLASLAIEVPGPDALIPVAVQKNILSMKEAVRRARRVHDFDYRTEIFTALIGLASDTEYDEIMDYAISSANEINDAELKVKWLVEIATKSRDSSRIDLLNRAGVHIFQLSPESRVGHLTLLIALCTKDRAVAVRTLLDDIKRTAATRKRSKIVELNLSSLLRTVAPHLSASELRQTLAIVNDLPEPNIEELELPLIDCRTKAILYAHLGQRGGEDELDAYSQALYESEKIQYPSELIEIASCLPSNLKEEMIGRAVALANGESSLRRAATLASIISKLPARTKEEIVEGVIAASSKLQEPEQRIYELAAVLPHATVEQRNRILRYIIPSFDNAVLKTMAQSPLGYALEILPPYVPQELIEKLLTATELREFAHEQAALFDAVLPYVSEETAVKAWEILGRVSWPPLTHRRSVVRLGPYLPIPLLNSLFQENDQRWDDHFVVAKALLSMIPYLSGAEKAESLLNAKMRVASVQSLEYRAILLTRLVDDLNGPDQIAALIEALKSIRDITDPWQKSELLSALAPKLPKDLLRDAIRSARSIDHAHCRLRCLSAIAEGTEACDDLEVWQDILNAMHSSMLVEASSLDEPAYAIAALRKVLPIMPRQFLEETLSVIRQIKDSAVRARGLSLVACYLGEDLQQNVLCDALQTSPAETVHTLLRCASPPSSVVVAIQELNSSNSPDEKSALRITDALTLVESFDEETRCHIIVSIAPYLKPGLLEQAFRLVETFANPNQKLRALTSLAEHADATNKMHLHNAIRIAVDEVIGTQAIEVLVNSASHGSEQQRAQIVKTVIAAIASDNGNSCASGLISLLESIGPFLSSEQLGEVNQAIMNIDSPRDRALMLGILVKFVHEPNREKLIEQKLDAIQLIDDLEDKAHFLIYGALEFAHSLVDYQSELGKLVSGLPLARRHSDAGAGPSLEWHFINALTTYRDERDREELFQVWAVFVRLLIQNRWQLIASHDERLAPVIFKMGGREAMGQVCHGLVDVTRWWP